MEYNRKLPARIVNIRENSKECDKSTKDNTYQISTKDQAVTKQQIIAKLPSTVVNKSSLSPRKEEKSFEIKMF